MHDTKSLKPPEIPDVDRQQLAHAMDIHAGRQPRVMDLYALDVVSDEQRAPAFMRFTTVGQKLEVPLDDAGEVVRFSDAQAKAVPLKRTRRGVPKLSEGCDV